MKRGVSPNSQHDVQRAAEVARSVLARASSAELTWLDTDGPRPGGTVGGVMIDDGDWTPDGAAVVEIADPAPLAVRDRIRARVRLHGYAAPDDERPGLVRMRIQGAELEHGGAVTWLSEGELRAAPADPLALREAALLSHLTTGHPELISVLTQLLPGEPEPGQVVPVALDRHGFTFRVVTGRDHQDVELPFPAPATSIDEIRCGVQALATTEAAGRRGTSNRRPGGLRGLGDLFRSGPAAARLCSPTD
jgi:hypothetical protein